jgi:hypothetical protein
MKTNKVISNILLFLIGISFVYVIVKIFKIKFTEGFDMIPSPLNPTPINNMYEPSGNIINNNYPDYPEPPPPVIPYQNDFQNQPMIPYNYQEEHMIHMKEPTRLEIYNKLDDISDNLFSDYDASQNFYNSSGNMIPQILSKLNDLTLKIDRTNNLKCVANFGTNIGDPLSNGIGVLSDTNYICPQELPNCAGMLCDQKYGVCTK